jgi:hypothetical protein
MQRELDALRKEIAPLRADGRRMNKHASAAATAGASSLRAIKEVGEIKSTLAGGASGAIDEIAEQLEELRETVSDYSVEAKKSFKPHPFVAIAGALAVGLLIGRLTR